MRNKETDMTLEKRIETAIAENTDPFTTDADIRFFETEEVVTPKGDTRYKDHW